MRSPSLTRKLTRGFSLASAHAAANNNRQHDLLQLKQTMDAGMISGIPFACEANSGDLL
jgi:hypothetical protein